MKRHSFPWLTLFALGLMCGPVGCTDTEEPAPGTTARTEASPLLAGERTLFPESALPDVAAENDGEAVELGVRFRSDAPGRVMGVRFYKGPGNTGTHTGSLWTASGSRLAQVTFTNETASGWQEARFATPVTISANTTYVVSYHAPMGHYAVTEPGFTSAVASPPLHAPADGDGGNNGLYHYGASDFPTGSYRASNYWVDVVFQPNDTTPPSAPTNVNALATSSTSIDLTWYASVDGSGEVRGNAHAHLVYRNGQLVAELPGTTLRYRDTGLTPSTTYRYTVRGRDLAGNLGPPSTEVTRTTLSDAACNPCSLWDNVTGKPQYLNADPSPTEVGLKFRSDVAGTVTKIRFYKSGSDNGPHEGHLWSESGTLLATTLARTGEGTSDFGWRELAFATPVPLQANTTYVVSYFAPGGYYPVTFQYFATSGLDVPPLHAPSTVEAGGNGVRLVGSSGFPTEAWLNTNFWVDVVFTPNPL
ncbi:DUF4082 domain-containing protein [Archangium minus]